MVGSGPRVRMIRRRANYFWGRTKIGCRTLRVQASRSSCGTAASSKSRSIWLTNHKSALNHRPLRSRSLISWCAGLKRPVVFSFEYPVTGRTYGQMIGVLAELARSLIRATIELSMQEKRRYDGIDATGWKIRAAGPLSSIFHPHALVPAQQSHTFPSTTFTLNIQRSLRCPSLRRGSRP
jgi:hypothetical protein